MLFAATASHPMIVLEFRHVSMRLCLRAAEVDQAAHAVAAIVQHQGFKEACIVGHSFGTFVASRLCQLHPSLVQSLVSTFVAARLCHLNPSLVQLLVSTALTQAQPFCHNSDFALTVRAARCCTVIHHCPTIDFLHTISARSIHFTPKTILYTHKVKSINCKILLSRAVGMAKTLPDSRFMSIS